MTEWEDLGCRDHTMSDSTDLDLYSVDTLKIQPKLDSPKNEAQLEA